MRMSKKLYLAIGILILFIGIGGGLFWYARPSENKGDDLAAQQVVERVPVIVGVLIPQTGPREDVGEEMRAVLDLATEEINRAGGVQGRDVVLKYVDSGCDPDTAQRAMRELIDVAPAAIIGGICRSESLVAARIAQGAGVPFISPAAAAKEYSEIGNMVFRFVPSEVQEGEAAAEAAAKATSTRAAVFACAQDDCRALADAFSNALAVRKIPLVVSGTIATSSQGIGAQIKTLVSNRANFIYLPAGREEAQLFLDALSSSSLKAAVYLPRLEGEESFRYASNTLVYELRLSNPDGTIILQKLAERGWGKGFLSQTAYRSYDILKKLADALTLSSVNNLKTAEVFSKISDWQGVADRYSIDPQTGDLLKASIVPVIAPNQAQ